MTVTGQDTTDLTLSGLSGTDTLTFSTTTWDDAQTVTVKAREDTDAANDKVTLTHAATGGEYEGVSSDLAVTVDDDETVSIVLSETTLTVVEGAAAGRTYTVKLSHEPSEEVTVTVTGQDTTDLTLSGSERDRHPDLQHDHLGRCADGDGEGRRGRRRQERLRHPDPCGHRRRVRGSVLRSGGDGGRRRDSRGGHQPHGHRRPGRRQQHLLGGPGVPARLGT